jgi:glutamine synthetase
MTKIEQWFADNAIEEVEALIPDFTGMAKGKFVPAERYLADKGFHIAEGLFTQTITGDYTEFVEDINPTDVDMKCIPDLETVRIVPWASYPVAQIIHDCFRLDGHPVEMAPRYILKRVLELYEKNDWRPVVAPETEFYLVKANIDPDYPLEPPVGQYGRQETTRRTFSIDAINEFENIIEDIYEYSEKQNLNLETLTQEDGVAQFEVNFMHGDPMDMADQVFLFKRTVRQAAYKHDIYATFMAKPYQRYPGSSIHLHQSIVNKKSGKNIFIDEKGKQNILFKNYIAGLQKYMYATMAIYAPNVNSYRRFTRYAAAPINTHWGLDNRTVGLRVPISSPEATRVENRVPGADTNPYLAIAATLAAGYLGITEKLTPTKPLETSAYDHEITLPRDLYESLKLMNESASIRKILGDQFIDLYIAVKKLEYEKFLQIVTPWEREYLLTNV